MFSLKHRKKVEFDDIKVVYEKAYEKAKTTTNTKLQVIKDNIFFKSSFAFGLYYFLHLPR